MPDPSTSEVGFEGATPILRVSDFEAGIRYYTDALGFELAWRARLQHLLSKSVPWRQNRTHTLRIPRE